MTLTIGDHITHAGISCTIIGQNEWVYLLEGTKPNGDPYQHPLPKKMAEELVKKKDNWKLVDATGRQWAQGARALCEFKKSEMVKSKQFSSKELEIK